MDVNEDKKLCLHQQRQNEMKLSRLFVEEKIEMMCLSRHPLLRKGIVGLKVEIVVVTVDGDKRGEKALGIFWGGGGELVFKVQVRVKM